MQEIIVFRAEDGTRFDTAGDCLKYEDVIKELCELFNILPNLPKDDGCSFVNGTGYIQHKKEVIDIVIDKFYALACSYHKGLVKYQYNSYGFWRTLDDSGSPFYSYGHRLLNIDENTLREYGQGYYKSNPQKSTGGQIN